MKKAILYLAVLLGALVYLVVLDLRGLLPAWLLSHRLVFRCVVAGGLGGILYCGRGVYLHTCVQADWTTRWEPWYYIRPIISLLCGGVGFLFLKGGLILLGCSQTPGSSDLGFVALSFVAGMNVDNFVRRIEEVSRAVWGREESRAAKGKLTKPKDR